MAAGVIFRTFALSDLWNELDLEDPQPQCYICTRPFSEEESLVEHEGVGATRHALHEECFKKSVRLQWTQHKQATCGICRRNIINFEDYLPTPLPITNKWLIGAAIGAISVIVSSIQKTDDGPSNIWVIASLAMQMFAIRRKFIHLKPFFVGMTAALIVNSRTGRDLFVSPLTSALSAWMCWAERPENYATVEAVFNLLSPTKM